MKSILLSTNERGRLPHLESHLPIPLVPVANRPLLIYGVELLVQHSVKEIFICVHDDAEEIEERIGGGKRWNVELEYLKIQPERQTAGIIKQAERHLTERFLVLPTDRLVDLDIAAVTEFHESHGGLLTAVLGTMPAGMASASGTTIGQEHGLILSSSGSDNDELYYTCAYLVEPEILEHIPNDCAFDLQNALISHLIDADVEVHGYQMDGYWNPFDSFRAYTHAQETVLCSLLDANAPTDQPTIRHPYVDAREIQRGVWCYQNTPIHDSIRFVPPVLIGPDCRIGRNAEIGPNVVIGANAIIGDGAAIQNSTILAETYVGKLLNIKQKIVSKELLIDTNTEAWANVEDPTLLAETNPAVVADILGNGVERLIALLVVIFLLPLLILLMVIVRVSIGSPVLYRTNRRGKRPRISPIGKSCESQILSLYHLRTRKPNGSAALSGQWIERWNLHRLPELLNVIQGDMSLGGGRLTKARR